MRDAGRDAAAGVLRDVPVLDAGGGAVAAGAVVGVGGDVADGVDVREAGDLEGLVGAQGAVVEEVDFAFEEVGGGPDADAEDDEVGGEGGAVFEVDGADVGGLRGGGGGFLDVGSHAEFDAVFFEELLEDGADFGAHDALHGGGFHPYDCDGVALLREAVGNFHADERTADDYDLFALLLARGGHYGLCICDEPEQEDVLELLEAGERECFWCSARC